MLIHTLRVWHSTALIATSRAKFRRPTKDLAGRADLLPHQISGIMDFVRWGGPAHGGLERWRRITSIKVDFDFHGALLDNKGYPGSHQPTVTIKPHGPPSTILTGLSREAHGGRWIFADDEITILAADGSTVARQPRPRQTLFQGHTLADPFSDLQLAYFVSYAMYNYLTVPFLFTEPGFQVEELEPHHEAGEIWRVLQVTHPDGFPTHTKVQKFYWGSEDFRLRRLDYITDILGGVAAHYCFDYKDFGGLLMPTVRRVVSRRNDTPKPFGKTAFWLTYRTITITDQNDVVSVRGEWVP